MIALVLGELKVPIPTPERTMPMTMCHAGESTPTVDSVNMAMADDNIPKVAGHRVPNLSDSLPLRGPSTAMPTAPGTSRRAAWRAS